MTLTCVNIDEETRNNFGISRPKVCFSEDFVNEIQHTFNALVGKSGNTASSNRNARAKETSFGSQRTTPLLILIKFKVRHHIIFIAK